MQGKAQTTKPHSNVYYIDQQEKQDTRRFWDLSIADMLIFGLKLAFVAALVSVAVAAGLQIIIVLSGVRGW